MKIALTYTGSPEKQENYVRWLKADQDVDVVTFIANDSLTGLEDCHGLVLTGGTDVYPSYYNKTEVYENAPAVFNPERDEFEIAAFKMMQQRGLPVLGVCRGLQLINCILGGTLQQDLGEGNKIHRAEGLVDKAHAATIQKGSLLQDIVNADRVVINSAHHQAVEKIGKGLMVNCLSDDGCIEGLERTEKNNHPFLLCIQWHPERMYKFHLQDTPVAKAIRDRFLAELKK